jgi:Flp pilus assembly protein TadG
VKRPSAYGPDRASVSLELVILAPVLITLMLLMFTFGVYADTESLVDQAARDGVRAATQSRSASEAQGRITDIVSETMSEASAPCIGGPGVSWRTTNGEFMATSPISRGPMNMVSVTVSCTVELGDAFFLPLGRKTITSTFVSPLDTFRGYYS